MDKFEEFEIRWDSENKCWYASCRLSGEDGNDYSGTGKSIACAVSDMLFQADCSAAQYAKDRKALAHALRMFN